MAANNTTRWIAIIVAIPVTIIIIAVIVAKIYFTGDRLRTMVIPPMESSMHRHISIHDISLSLFPSIGVDIDTLRISNPDGSNFERNDFVSLDRLLVRVKLIPLLAGRVEIGRISLTHPSIYFEVTKAGRKNYSGGEPEPSSPSAGGSGGSIGALVVSDLEIQNGEFEFVNNKFNSRMLFSGINLNASAGTVAGTSLAIDARIAVDKVNYGTPSAWYLSDQPFSSTAKISYSFDKDLLSFDDFTGKLRDLPIAVTGTMGQLQQKTAMMNLTVSSPGASMEQLLSLIPPDLLKKTQGLAASGTVKFSVTMKGPSGETIDPATTAEFSVSNGSIKYASLPKSITDIAISGTFEKPSAPITATGIGTVAIDRFSAHVGSNYIDAKLRVTDFADPAISSTITAVVDLGDIKDFYPLETGSVMDGKVTANISIAGKVKSPQTMTGKGTIDFANVTVQAAGSPKPVKNLNGTVAFNNQSIDAKRLAMNIGESDLLITMSMRNYLTIVMPEAGKSAGPPSMTATLTSHLLRTEDLMSDKPAAPPAAADKKSPPKKTGMLPGFDIAADVAIDKLVTDKFTFTNAKGSLGISNGMITLKTFSVNAFQGTVQTKGTLDLRDTKKRPFNLDLAITNVESNELLTPFTSFGNYLFGKLTMNTKLQGDLNDTLGLNTQTLTGDGLTKILSGRLSSFPLTTKLAEMTGASQLKEINFKDWTNNFSIANGRINIKDLAVNAGTTNFQLGGSQGLDGSLDYALTVKLPPELSGKLNLQGVGGDLLQFFKDSNGRMNLSFHVGGTTANPALQLDTRAQEEMAKKAVKQKVEDELKNKAVEGLKNLFKKP